MSCTTLATALVVPFGARFSTRHFLLIGKNVGEVGFEPTAFWSRTKRASQAALLPVDHKIQHRLKKTNLPRRAILIVYHKRIGLTTQGNELLITLGEHIKFNVKLTACMFFTQSSLFSCVWNNVNAKGTFSNI